MNEFNETIQQVSTYETFILRSKLAYIIVRPPTIYSHLK